MIRLRCIILLLGLLLLESCNIYKRSFSETFKEIPEATKKPIYRLDLSHQNFLEAPEKITELSHLKMLNLSANVGLDLEKTFEKISNPERLEILILDSLELREVPHNIKRFTHLKHLSLTNNPQADFTTIFKTVHTLPISFVNLQNNALEELPPALGQLKDITHINLSHNRLHLGQAYTILAMMPKLNSLWLTYNELKELPPEIGQLSPLRNLYIEHNALTDLPEEITDLKKVWVLHAGHNQFKEIPTVLSRMKILLLLHINNNHIHTIPEEFASKKNSIKGIILDNNALSDADKKRWAKEFNHCFISSF